MDARRSSHFRDEPQTAVETRCRPAPAHEPAVTVITAPAPAPATLALLIQQADLDLDIVTGLIAPDPVLSARVLRLANTVTFNRGVPVRCLAEAVARLGFVPLRQLLNTAPGHVPT